MRLPPEAASWFGAQVPSGAVVVGGVAGGVGTTTVARLLAAGLERWRTGAGTLTVLDAGREPWLAPLPALPVVAHVVVCRADVDGLRAAAAGLAALGLADGGVVAPGGVAPGAVVVPVPAAGAGTPPGRLRRLAGEVGLAAAVVPLPRSRALAAGGPDVGPAAVGGPAVAPVGGPAVAPVGSPAGDPVRGAGLGPRVAALVAEVVRAANA